MTDERAEILERMLRKARQQIWDKPERWKAIAWLKRQLEPYWYEHRYQPDTSRWAIYGW